MEWQARLVVAGFVGVIAGAIGPRVLAAPDRPGGAFEYVPPPAFVESAEATATLGRTAIGGQRAWVAQAATPGGYTPNVTFTHAADAAPQDTREVAALAHRMVLLFASSGLDWAETRELVHVRPDGARVAVIEWTHAREGSGAAFRMMQMAFPDGAGSSIVTALFPDEDAAKWERDFAATLDTAKGLAFRAPPPPLWTYAAWGVGAAVAIWGALSALARTRSRAAESAA
jgi:hypothetical protein